MIIARAFSMAVQIERQLISQHTKEALRAQQAARGKLGRLPDPENSKLDIHKPEIEALLTNGATQRFVAERFDTTEANLHNWLNKRGLKKITD